MTIRYATRAHRPERRHMTGFYPPDEEVFPLTGYEIRRAAADPTDLYADTVWHDWVHWPVLRRSSTNDIVWNGTVGYGSDMAAIRAAQAELKTRMSKEK